MKRRYLVLLFATFFMFLYIGPVNLLPYDVPSTIPTEQNMTKELKEQYTISTDLDVVLAADTDDDYWDYLGGHTTTDVVVKVKEGGQVIGQWRFALTIPQGAIIDSADLTMYETQDDADHDCEIWRIDEDNVGDLEADGAIPDVDTSTTCWWDFDAVATEWQTADVTDIVQVQVDLVGWSSGNYIGFRLNQTDSGAGAWWKFADYQSGSNYPYLNITYTFDDGGPYGDNWLVGWNRRKNHTITQTAGTGVNYTVPFWVYESAGEDSGNTTYLNYTSQADFDDIRWTNGSGDVLLDFNLNLTEQSSGGADYYVNDAMKFDNYPGCYPHVWYYNDRTYVVYPGPKVGDETNIAGDPYILYYDHENSTWSDIVWIAENPQDGDSHGPPVLWINNTGHIHVIYGAHNDPLKHAVSTNPEDISSWTILDDLGTGATYPHISYDSDNNVVHMYCREWDGHYLAYYNSSDGGQTWGNPQHIFDVDNDLWPYMEGAGGIDPYNNELLHIAWTAYYESGDHQDVFYLYVNVTTGNIYNVTGDYLGQSITVEQDLIDDCKVYDTDGQGTWGVSVHVDSDSTPYLMWGQVWAGESEATQFTYWNGTGWDPVVLVSEPRRSSAPNDFIVYSSTNITAFLADYNDMYEYDWDGSSWTQGTSMYNSTSGYQLSFSCVPHATPGGIGHHNATFETTFCEWVSPPPYDQKAYAWGIDGIITSEEPTRAKFYVTIPTNLSESNAVIYIYYDRSVAGSASQQLDYTSGNDPNHGAWGAEETAGYFNPVNEQAPTLDNPDDTDNMYARFKEYNITMYVSDGNGYADIDFLKLGFWDDGRSHNYARWRYDSPEDTFVEEYDFDDYFELNLTKSEAIKSGDYINCTFVFTVDWSCPDMTDVHMDVTVRDNIGLYDVDDHHFLTWDVETRLDFTPALNDGFGTVDRGDYDTLDGITANGTLVYFGGTVSPDTDDVDVWVSCSDINGSPWSDTTLTAGVFSVTVDSDDIVGLDIYTFIVVEEGAGSGGSDLSHTTHTDTYIADRLVINMQADDESPDNNVQVDFTLTVIYDYDDTVCTTYQIVISRNSIWWHSFINANKSLFVDIDSNVIHSYTMSYLTNETTHGLTKFISNIEVVTWSAAATTTTTGTGIFYELFLSLDMWGYLGPLGIVVIGYVLAKKDRGLGLIAFMVQCLIAAQYFALVSTTPEYWWHIYIILFGGLFSCVIPLIDR